MEASNILDRTSGIGLRGIIGANEMPSRYQTRSAAGAIFGPTYGSFMDMFTLLHGMTSGQYRKEGLKQGDVNIIKGNIPGVNLPYVQPFVAPVFNVEK